MALNRLRQIQQRLLDSLRVLMGKAYCYPKNTYQFHALSFSQEGEDGILQRIFEQKESGFYVDIGCHHPQRFSNTYRFYLRGWNGINIDPLPGSKARFDALRKRDINLEVAISDSPGELIYYAFQEPALNTFDSQIAHSRESHMISANKIRVYRLKDILDEHLEPDRKIDFLSIDVEGLDLQVIRSNDWVRYRPSYVLVEALGMRDMNQVLNSELHSHMSSLGYSIFSKCVNTLFYVDEQPIENQ